MDGGLRGRDGGIRGWGERAVQIFASGNGSVQIFLHSLWRRGWMMQGPLGGWWGRGIKRVGRACVR